MVVVCFIKRLLHLRQQDAESTHRHDTGDIKEDSREKHLKLPESICSIDSTFIYSHWKKEVISDWPANVTEET